MRGFRSNVTWPFGIRIFRRVLRLSFVAGFFGLMMLFPVLLCLCSLFLNSPCKPRASVSPWWVLGLPLTFNYPVTNLPNYPILLYA